jgi:hypothetical protein
VNSLELPPCSLWSRKKGVELITVQANLELPSLQGLAPARQKEIVGNYRLCASVVRSGLQSVAKHMNCTRVS